MAIKVGELFSELKIETGGAERTLSQHHRALQQTGQAAGQMERSVESGSRSIRDMATASGTTEGALSRLGGMMQNVISTAAGFVVAQVGMRVVGAAADFVKESFIGMNDLLEQTQVAFTTMLGSAELAGSFIQDLADFAARTPFDFPGLLKASQRMLAYGFAAQEVLPLLEDIGNVSAGLGAGAQGIDRITIALGQMTTKGRVQTQELLQLTEAGVPAFQMLADAVGVSTGEIQDMVSAGEISSDVFLRIFHEWAQANFGDMMEKQSRTFTGAMSNITDVMQMGIARGLEPFFNALRDGAIRVAEFLETDRFNQWVSTLAQVSQRAVDAILAIPETATAFRDWVSNILSGGVTLNEFLGTLPGWFQEALGRIQDMMNIGGHNAIVAYAQGIVDGASTYVTQAINYVADLIASYLVGQSPPPDGPLSQIDDAGRRLMETYTDGMADGAKGAERAGQSILEAMQRLNEEAALTSAQQGFAAATGNLEAMEAVAEDVESKIRDINREIAQIDLEIAGLDREIEAINDIYDAQIDLLEEQKRIINEQYDLQNQRLKLENDLARAQLDQQRALALGDPERRAEIAGERTLLEIEEERAQLERDIAKEKAILSGEAQELTDEERKQLEFKQRGLEIDRAETQERLRTDKDLTANERARLQLRLDQTDAAIAANQALMNGEGRELTPEEREMHEMRLRGFELRQEELALIDETALAEADKSAAILDAREKQLDIDERIAEAERDIALIPIDEKIAAANEEREKALEPLEAQKALYEEQKEDLDYLRQQWQFLKGDLDTALEPLREMARLQEQAAKDAERQAKELENAAKAAERAAKARPDNSFEAAQARLRGEDSCPPGWVMDEFGRCSNPAEEAWKQSIKDAESAGAGGLQVPDLPGWDEMFPEKDALEVPVTPVVDDNLNLDMAPGKQKSLGEQFGALFADGFMNRAGQLVKENMGRILGASLGGAALGAVLGPAGRIIGGVLGGLIGDSLQKELAARGVDVDDLQARFQEVFEQDVLPTVTRVAGMVMDVAIPAIESLVEFVRDDLLPAFERFSEFVQDHVIPVAERLFGFLSEHKETILAVVAGVVTTVAVFKTLTATIAIVVGAVATVMGVIGSLATTFTAAGGGIAGIVAILGGPLTIAIAAIAIAIGLLVTAWVRNWGDIQGKTAAVWNFVRPILEGINERFQQFRTMIMPEVLGAWENIRIGVTTAARFIWATVSTVFAAVSGFISEHSDTIMKFVDIAWNYIQGTIDNVLSVISNIIQLVLNVIQGDWEGAWENVKSIFQTVWDQVMLTTETYIGLLYTYLTEALPIIVSHLAEWGGAFLGWIASDVLPFIVDKLGEISTALLAWITDTALPWIKDSLKAWGAAFIDWVTEQVLGEDGLVAKLREVASAIVNWIGDKGRGATASIKTKLLEFAAAFVDWISETVLGTGDGSLVAKLADVLQAIIDWATDTENLTKAANAVKSIGEAIVEGIWEGIKGLGSWFKEKVGDWVDDNVPDFIADRLKSESPAKVMFPIGESIPQGVAVGIERGKEGLRRSLSGLTDGIVDNLSVSVPRIPATMSIPATMGAIGASSQQAAPTNGLRDIIIPIYRKDGTLEEQYVIDIMNQHVQKVYG